MIAFRHIKRLISFHYYGFSPLAIAIIFDYAFIDTFTLAIITYYISLIILFIIITHITSYFHAFFTPLLWYYHYYYYYHYTLILLSLIAITLHILPPLFTYCCHWLLFHYAFPTYCIIITIDIDIFILPYCHMLCQIFATHCHYWLINIDIIITFSFSHIDISAIHFIAYCWYCHWYVIFTYYFRHYHYCWYAITLILLLAFSITIDSHCRCH